MLPLIKVSDRAELVCTEDPSVKVKDGQDFVHWVLKSEAKTDGKELVATVRPLTSSELLRCQGFVDVGDGGSADLTVQAAKAGTTALSGPGLSATDPQEVEATLDRLSPAALASLGGWVLARSLETEDPI